jgi:ubiquinone/menaquinone biosynthesis C-methylase UbiE
MTIDRNEAALRQAGHGIRLLDIGCGLGDILYLSADRFEALHGVDAVAEMVTAAKVNLSEHKQSANAQIDVATADALPYPDRYFDAVTLLDVFEHIAPTRRAASLQEIRRVLKPGGRLVLATPSRRILRFWQVVDGILSLPVHVLRKREVRIWRFRKKEFTEVFCTRSELISQLRDNGFAIEETDRVSFYPAPETTGFFGMCLQLASRMPTIHRLLCKSVELTSKLTFLRQKILVRCAPINAGDHVDQKHSVAA